MKKPFALTLAVLCVINAWSQIDFQKPPKEILELIDVKPVPSPHINRTGTKIVFVENAERMTLDVLAEPELKLAGLRINPNNHNRSRTNPAVGLYIQDVASGQRTEVKGLPSGLRISYAGYSPRENYFTFVHCLKDKLELWVIDLKTNEAVKAGDRAVSAAMVYPYEWAVDESALYFFERVNNAAYSDEKTVPAGPAIQESSGQSSTIRTYQDLLKNKADEKKFDYYATVKISKYLPATKQAQDFLPAKVYTSMSVSPDGNYVLAAHLNAPYSYLLPSDYFPSTVEVYGKDGKLVKEIVRKPLQDKIPQGFDGTEEGPRNVQWRSDRVSSLVYAEAQDGGDPKKEAQYRDEVYTWEAPFTAKPNMIARTVNRFQYIQFGPDGIGIMVDGWWKTRNRKVYLLNAKQMLGQQVIFDYSTEEAYKLPGNFLSHRNEKGEIMLMTDKKFTKLYLNGEGYSPEGKRPFVDEYDLKTKTVKRLWQADGKSTYERLISVVDIEKGEMITRIESKTKYPNYYSRNFKTKKLPRAITAYENPYKSIEGIGRQKIEYTREDGVKLFGTLYLPAGYDKNKDGKLPLLIHAYPTEFKDDKAAGQSKGSPHEFVFINWSSPIFWVTRGFAVLDDAQFPIVGKGDAEPNDTYITQLVGNAKAAIKATHDMGICDTARVAVMGHSYGAFMTANLLAHSNLFAAGIARSGAYNRTLTPFGFQSEERTYWQATDVYHKMSPFDYADQIKKPLLMIHGDADNNPGTFTMQSERLFQAIKGTGGTARLVLLPYESHGYSAKENVLHMLWEMDTWLDKYVKNKK